MTRPPVDAAAWRGWIEHVCAAVGVDAALVDVGAIHELSGEVAAVFARPMAPVSAHLWGLARGRFPDADPAALGAELVAAASGR